MLHANQKTRGTAAPLPRSALRLSPLLLVFLLTTLTVRAAIGAAMAGPTIIPGSPLTILVADDASFQVQRINAFGSDPDLNGMVYPNLSDYGDAGIFVRYALDTIGPNFNARDTTTLDGRFEAWTPVAAPALSGSGTLSNPYRTHAALEHASGVTLTVDIQYVNGQEKFLLSWTVCPPSGGAGFNTYLAADVQLTNTLPELSQSGFDPVSGAVSAYNPSSGFSQHFKPLVPADAYMAANEVITATLPRPLWDAIQSGQNLSNSVPPVSETGDNSLALQWRQLANACRSINVEWHVLLGPQIPDLLTIHSYLPLIRKQ